MIRIPAERLSLRTPSLEDLADYLAYRNDPQGSDRALFQPATVEEATTLLMKQSRLTLEEPGWLMLAIEDAKSGRVVGEVGAYRSAEHMDRGNVGWWLHPAHRGQGLATEAVSAFIDWCFGDLGLTLVDASSLAANVRSWALMERAGMRRQDPPGRREIGGVIHEELTYCLSRAQWSASRG
ncbi:GNAT family N-acetyltransferase [Mitsuaria sp. 7]|uniref:GNAT family N-acetyltransferase n=1 Tax=Mitsuaria sp. 7 TaxID=1658665 RepID=UPI0008294E92|nr:GNAT family N-acetyltransferase [Mitsuaria sp. 7]